MNRTAKVLARIFKIGEDGTNGQIMRINQAIITPDTSPPNVSFKWKTHKVYNEAPPTRPVCDSSEGPIARASSLITMILSPLLKERKYPEEADSTEDMLFSVHKANNRLRDDPELGNKTFIFSMDAEALYPS